MSKYLIATLNFLGAPPAAELQSALDKLEEGGGENWRLHTILGPLLTNMGPSYTVYFQGEKTDS